MDDDAFAIEGIADDIFVWFRRILRVGSGRLDDVDATTDVLLVAPFDDAGDFGLTGGIILLVAVVEELLGIGAAA